MSTFYLFQSNTNRGGLSLGRTFSRHWQPIKGRAQKENVGTVPKQGAFFLRASLMCIHKQRPRPINEVPFSVPPKSNLCTRYIDCAPVSQKKKQSIRKAMCSTIFPSQQKNGNICLFHEKVFCKQFCAAPWGKRYICLGRQTTQVCLSIVGQNETSQELRMLSSVTINCQVLTKIVMKPGSQLSVL